MRRLCCAIMERCGAYLSSVENRDHARAHARTHVQYFLLRIYPIVYYFSPLKL